jgi:deoxyribodipyrimidine photo-lyase
MSNTYQLIWFRQDLSVRDQAALWHARQNGPCIAICILSPEQWQRHDDADIKIDFYLRQLLELKTELSKLQIPLLIFTVPFGMTLRSFLLISQKNYHLKMCMPILNLASMNSNAIMKYNKV